MILETLLASQSRIETLLERAAIIADASVQDAEAASPYIARGLTIAVAVRVCDHADSIVPRLRGRCPMLDAALGRLFADHRESLKLVGKLHAAREWEAPVLSLGYVFVRSFALEEEVVFSAVRAYLSDSEQRAVVREMRMRRSRRTAPTNARHPNGSVGNDDGDRDREGAAEHPWLTGGGAGSVSLVSGGG